MQGIIRGNRQHFKVEKSFIYHLLINRCLQMIKEKNPQKIHFHRNKRHKVSSIFTNTLNYQIYFSVCKFFIAQQN